MKLAILAIVLASATSASAQKFNVTIIDRHEDETDYTYVAPGHPNSDAKTNLNCNPAANNAICNGSIEAPARSRQNTRFRITFVEQRFL